MATKRRPAGRPAPTTDDLGLVDALVQLSFSIQALLSSIAAEHDLSMTQVRLLGILRDREPAMLEIARVLKLEKSSVTGLVDRAQRRGLVTRSSAAHDGRAVHVRLTPVGQDIAHQFAGQIAKRLADLVRPLSAAERAQLSKIVSRIVIPHAGGHAIDPSAEGG
jgi:DNA-binding MarR family transcriptional regulator